MELLQGFPPVAAGDAHTLILGSMPGVMSLQKQQYYAFGRNAFWRIMGELFGAGPELDYRRRLEILVENRIALWDVIAACHRPGSLDSAIRDADLVTNDFEGFLAHHQHIERICFNGQKASSLFRKRVLPSLATRYEYITLPSTSPAHAARNYARKLDAWSVIRA
jgi:hypoxanthine-DNA glycosylase